MKNYIAAIMLAWSMASLADFNSALDQYHNQQYQAAYEEFLSLAAIGEKRSQFNLGVMYYNGEHVAKDVNMAYAWSQIAAESETFTEREHNITKLIADKVTDQALADQQLQILKEKYSHEALTQSLYPTLVAVKESKSFKTTPIKTVPPEYPHKALRKNINGIVKVIFDIDSTGRVRNHRILEAIPEKIFNKTALKAVKKWHFEAPVDENGEPTHVFNKAYVINYNIDGSAKVTDTTFFQNLLEKAMNGEPNAQYAVGKLAAFDPSFDTSLNINPTEFYLKAALSGLNIAQYDLGKALINGNGCKADKTKGIDWVTRAATNGHLDAIDYLVVNALKNNSIESQQTILKLSKDESKLAPHVKVRLAWMLATTQHKSLADPKRALKLIKDITRYDYNDTITLFEIKAAAYAALGDFEEAVDYQEDALSKAKRRKVYLGDIKKRLATLEKGQNPYI
jgi:uncharacterized protein